MNKLFAYPGGKWPVRHLIVSAFPKHRTYVDVFGGAASILITKERSEGEVFNDLNREIVNFFRVVKHRPAELAERARHWIHSRALFDALRDAHPPEDELERAFPFWVLLADSFGSRCRNYGMAKDGIHSVTRARAHLSLVADRLRDVHVECLDFANCIRLYDSPETFFYCDPPYRGTRGGDSSYELLTDEEWKTLFESLGGIKGKFLLSSNNDRLVVKLFKRFHIRNIDVRVTLPRKKGISPRKEVLISNYRLPNLKARPGKRDRSIRATMNGDRPAARRGRSLVIVERLPSKV